MKTIPLTPLRWNPVALLALLGILPCLTATADSVYVVRQSYTVMDTPAGAKQVRGWFWMPENRPEQQVLDFKVVEAPESLRVTRDPRYGRSWLYAEVAARADRPLRIVTEFTILRRSVSGMADPAKAGAMTDQHRRAFAADLVRDEKHMVVTPAIQKIADELAGQETNPVIQARKFFDYVILKSEHYSKSGPSPKGLSLGDATECLLGNGDTCTDQHALFIALCRARGIPCRLMYGSRIKPENAGKDHDPGYRCWPNFFAPGLGWVPLDVSSGDTGGDRAGQWFGGLDDNRLEWAEGRDFDFEPRSQVRPDLVIRGWVEVDKKPHAGMTRVINFRKVDGRAEGGSPTAPKIIGTN
ncbi:MAG: transglutaminase domain-containing protein [Opitutaceae bacterium]|nr:transglutaminase domain-containing protein [Verrucomicrobiales bacterium]